MSQTPAIEFRSFKPNAMPNSMSNEFYDVLKRLPNVPKLFWPKLSLYRQIGGFYILRVPADLQQPAAPGLRITNNS